MKKIEYWESIDGIRFSTQIECEEHEKSKALYTFIEQNIERTYCDDAGYSVIENSDVEKFIQENFAEIYAIVTRQELL